MAVIDEMMYPLLDSSPATDAALEFEEVSVDGDLKPPDPLSSTELTHLAPNLIFYLRGHSLQSSAVVAKRIKAKVFLDTFGRVLGVSCGGIEKGNSRVVLELRLGIVFEADRIWINKNRLKNL